MAGSDARLRAPESVLTVDLGAIVANYRALAARAAPAQCSAVVKADAYGLGALHVGPALAQAGCRHFFVAHLGEAVELRGVVPAPAAIYVLNGLAQGDVETLLAHDLVPVLNDLSQVDAWAATSRRLGRALPAVIQFDTGMSRLGLEDGEFRTLHTERTRLAPLDLRLVMSHLACAEETDNPLNRAQLAEFKTICAAFPDSKASFANSSGIFLGPDYAFDLVRPGCALYGINPLLNKENPMKPVVRLESRIVQVRRVDHPPDRWIWCDPSRFRPNSHRHHRHRICRWLASFIERPRRGLLRRSSGALPRSRVDGSGDSRRHRRARREDR